MNNIMIPVFVQVLLTMALLMATGLARASAIRSKAVRVADVALGQPGWPRRVTQIGNAFHNQLEMPFLFYVAVVFARLGGTVTTGMLVCAWAYVALRLIHAFIHVTSNNVPRRFAAFLLSNLCVGALWVQVAVLSL